MSKEVELLTSLIHSGKFYRAGDKIAVEDKDLKKLISQGFAKTLEKSVAPKQTQNEQQQNSGENDANL